MPQLGVLNGLLARGLPPVLLPPVDPASDPFEHVLAVRMERDAARLDQRLERADRGGQLHAVVGGRRVRAGQLLLVLAHAQDRAPPAGAGIALAGAIGEYFDVLHPNTPALAASA